MGVLSELVIADQSESPQIVISNNPSAEWNGFECKGIDTVKFAKLWMILEGRGGVGLDVFLEYHNKIEALEEAGADGPWLFLIPSQLRDLLANCSNAEDAEVKRIADTWAATEEFEGWAADEVFDIFGEIINLADTARLEGRALLLWMCL